MNKRFPQQTLQESRHSHFKDSEKHHCCRVKKGFRSDRNGKRGGRYEKG
jgi:hypothetical protein